MLKFKRIISIIKGLKFWQYGSIRNSRLTGRCRIRNNGSLQIGNGFIVSAEQVPVHITVENNDSKLIIGKNVFINYGVDIGCSLDIEIGDNVKIGPMTNIIDFNYHQVDSKKESLPKSVKIGKNVWIGRNCIILPGVVIGENSIIAAGSIVTKDVNSNIIVGGNPAIFIRDLDITDNWVRN